MQKLKIENVKNLWALQIFTIRIAQYCLPKPAALLLQFALINAQFRGCWFKKGENSKNSFSENVM